MDTPKYTLAQASEVIKRLYQEQNPEHFMLWASSYQEAFGDVDNARILLAEKLLPPPPSKVASPWTQKATQEIRAVNYTASDSPKQQSEEVSQRPPWLRDVGRWSPESMFFQIWESSYFDLGVRVYDIATNLLGSMQLYVGNNPIAWIVLLIGAILISFSETVGLQAYAEFQRISNLPKTEDVFIDQFRRKTRWFYLLVSVASAGLWMLDLLLSAIPWIILFGRDSPIGYVVGGTVSMMVEFVELRSQNRKIEEIASKMK